MLNGIVFLIIGLELPEIVAGLHAENIPVSTAIGYGTLVTGVLITARMISVYVAMVATFIFRPGVVPTAGLNTRRWLIPFVLGWCGMRGVVSLAAALAIPITLANGIAFPQRNLILFITFVTILLTLVVQGLTLPYLIKKTHVFDDLLNQTREEETRKKMKRGLKEHMYQFLKNKYENELNGHTGLEKFIKQLEERSKAADDSWLNETSKKIFIELLESQRQYLNDLNKDSNIDEEIIRVQLYQIDLEEERLKIV
jgi:NhaP-type Na+/H+ or K+/H+ antiporter